MIKQFLKISLLITVIVATKFSLGIESYEKQCFY